MKIICLKENLKDSLLLLERVSSKNQNLPILNNILLKTEKGVLKTFATDLEIGAEVFIPAKVEKDGEMVLPVRLLTQFINNLPNTKITIEEKGGRAHIELENVKTTIPLINSSEFPLIPKIKKDAKISIKPETLKTAIVQVLNAAASSHPIQEILGILFIATKEVLKVVSTDSFRLSEKTIYQKNNYTFDSSAKFIIPQKTAQELSRVINQTENIDIYLEANQIMFKLKNINLISRLIIGSYPNYEQIIPKKHDAAVLVDKNELSLKLKLASLFSSKINDVKLVIDSKNGNLEIKSSDPHKGEFSTSISTEIKGQGFDLVFNYKYLIDGLTNIYTEGVIFELNKPPLPSLIKSQDDNYQYVVMPIKV